MPVVAVQQHDAGRGDVEREAQQRRQQQHGREHARSRAAAPRRTPPSRSTSDSAMLNVNSTSSSSGGSGTTIIASSASRTSGTPRPRRSRVIASIRRAQHPSPPVTSKNRAVDRRRNADAARSGLRRQLDARRGGRRRARGARGAQLVTRRSSTCATATYSRGRDLLAELARARTGRARAAAPRTAARRARRRRRGSAPRPGPRPWRRRLGARDARLVVAQRHGVVRRVRDHDVGLRHFLHHAARRDAPAGARGSGRALRDDLRSPAARRATSCLVMRRCARCCHSWNGTSTAAISTSRARQHDQRERRRAASQWPIASSSGSLPSARAARRTRSSSTRTPVPPTTANFASAFASSTRPVQREHAAAGRATGLSRSNFGRERLGAEVPAAERERREQRGDQRQPEQRRAR